MLQTYLFLRKYNIIKEPSNLSIHTKEFFKLNHKVQRKVLDKYFNSLDKNFDINYYFNNKNSFYYYNGKEISFFNSYYFNLKILKYNINNIRLIDKFNIKEDKITTIINNILKEPVIKKLDINSLFIYPDELPKRLSSNINFMKYLVDLNYYNIKYITYNQIEPERQRNLIKYSISIASQNKYNKEKFLNSKKQLPTILTNNIDFLLYLIENDLNNITYINEFILNNLTTNDKHRLILSIIKSDLNINILKENKLLFNYLTKDYNFIIYLIKNNINNITYIDWHNIIDTTKDKIINNIITILKTNHYNFNINNYPFKNIFYQNYNFMLYLIEQNPHNIKYTKLTDKSLNDKLIDIYLDKISTSKDKFNINNYIQEDNYINPYLIQNERMFKYLFSHNNNLIKYINFFNLDNPSLVISYIIKQINNKEYTFNNNNFIINNKYPIHLSNSYLFMKYVIDENFNNLAYINTSVISNKELHKIIDYSIKVLKQIKGTNKTLSFDIDGYFKDSDIIHNEYFKECLSKI